jgi:hypothetical protein
MLRSEVSKMAFIELNRSFFPLLKDHEPSLEFGRAWGRKLGGWLEWSDLLELRRVVVLAEASSGKSEEFRNQVKQLNAKVSKRHSTEAQPHDLRNG